MRAASLLQGRVLSSKVPAVPKSFAPPPRRVVVVGRSSIAPTATAHRRGRAQNVRTAAAPERRDEVKVLAAPPQDDPSFFLEPLLRSFVLGVSAGCLFESLHVAFKFVGLATEVGLSSVADALPAVIDRFSPLFAGDHAVALGSWALFYIIEAVAVVSVLKRFPDDRAAAEREVRKQVTLGKKMFPLRLAPALQQKREKAASSLAASSTLSSSSSSTSSSSSSSSSSPLTTEADKGAAAATSLSATAVLEAPPKEKTSSSSSSPIPGAVEIPGGGAGVSSLLPPPLQKEPETFFPREKQRQQLERSRDGTDEDDDDDDDAIAAAAEEEKSSSSSLAERRKRSGLAPGALDPANPLGRRARELRGRRAYLKNFWYAVALSEEVKDDGKPVGVTALGRRLALFRDAGDEGRVKAVSDVCPHRGAPLHQGWVADNVGGGTSRKEGGGGGGKGGGKGGGGRGSKGHSCVVCPYHGWAFDGQGVLRDVPAAEHPDEWPRKQLVESYPIVEKGGFVWLFYGSPDLPEDERPPIPFVPELEDPKWKAVYGSIEMDCEHHDVFQNAIDVAHIHYLHSDSFGNQDKPEIRGMHVKADAYGATASFSLHNKPVNALWAWSSVPKVDVTARAMLPSTSMISFTLAGGLSFITFVNTVPISPGKAINRFALIRKLDADPTGGLIFNSSAWDGIARRAMLKILGEDKGMLEQLRPQDLPREISVRADLLQTAFGKLRGEYLQMGYGVDPPSDGGDEGVGTRGGLGLKDL